MLMRVAELLVAKEITAADKILHMKFEDSRGMGGNWEFFCNGTKETQTVHPKQWGKFELEPFSLAVWWNGWLAGVINPKGGMIAFGSRANEAEFIKSLEAYLEEGGMPLGGESTGPRMVREGNEQ